MKRIRKHMQDWTLQEWLQKNLLGMFLIFNINLSNVVSCLYFRVYDMDFTGMTIKEWLHGSFTIKMESCLYDIYIF